MPDSLLTRSYITVLVAVSVGSILCWAILANSQYYTCSTTEDNLVSTSIALDAVRVVLAALSVVIVQTKPDPNKRIVSTICCMLSCAVLLGMFTAWSEACDKCLLRTTTKDQFDASLAEMFGKSQVSGNPCVDGAASTESYWYNPKSWCRESTKVNCYELFALDNVHSIKSVQPCIRYGCTDYMPEAQWAFLVEIVGDLCRVLVFYMYTTSLSGAAKQTKSKKQGSEDSDNEQDSTAKQGSDSENDEADSGTGNSLLRRRRQLDLSF